MGTINITCTQCNRQLAVPDRYQGRDLKCPSCGHPFRVDPPEAAPAPKPEPDPRLEVFPESAPPSPPMAVGGPFGDSPVLAQPAPVGATGDTAFVEATAVYWRVKRVGVLSAAALGALIHAVMGAFVGVAVAAVSFTPLVNGIPFLHGPSLGALAILVLPPVYGLFGFVLGAAMALVYNFAARLAGGIRVLLE
ncbi:MAG: zinc-ribbon domain-containing protein [Acidobacteriia bacterium]|nr:zinc-ribbon domain-containing protein [Terriglobia bacterium]